MTDHQQHPTIVLSPELMRQWRQQTPRSIAYLDAGREERLMERAAQWVYEQCGKADEAQLQKARDEELEACIAWLDRNIPGYELVADRLRDARRPKPPTRAEIALKESDKMVDQITLEKALELVDFEFRSKGWRVKHVKGNVRGSVGGTVCGNVLGSVWGNVKGNVRGNVTGTINGRQWKFIETPEERLRRLIEEGADKDEILEALDQLEDSNESNHQH